MFKGFHGAAAYQPALPLDNRPRPNGSHALHCAVLNNIVWRKKLALLPRAIKLQGYKAARLAQTAPIQEIPDKGNYGSCLIL
jgi:hypothetical protein